MVDLRVLNELTDKEIELLDREHPPYRTNEEVYDAISHELKDFLENVEQMKWLMSYDIPKCIRKEEAINPTLIHLSGAAERATLLAIQIIAICERAIFMDETEDGERKPADY